ncbi:MAG: acyl-homoserine-lactone synthase [Caulobacteraceae bacterium]
MIHLVTAANRHLYEPQLQAMHAERKRQFVDGRGWNLPVRDGGEYDQFDDADAVYLIGFDSGGQISVSARIRPTLSGGVIADVFPHLVLEAEQPIRAAGAYECTRYFTTGHHRGLRGFEARSRLHIALIETVRHLNGRRLLGLVDLDLMTHLRRFSGLRLRPIGLPAAYDEGGVTIAFEIGVCANDLAHAQTVLQIRHRQLFIAPEWLPSNVDVLAIERATSVVLAAPDTDRRAFSDRVARLAEAIVYHPDVEALMANMALEDT